MRSNNSPVGRLLIFAWGSRGDVAPLLGAGARLRTAGYEVTVAADRGFAGLVADAGLEFRATGGDMRAAADREEHSATARDGVVSRSGGRMLRMARQYARSVNADVAGIAADVRTDVILFTPLASAAYHVAEALGIPSVGLHLQPQQPTAEYPPMVAGRSLGRLGNRAAGRLLQQAERVFFAGINDIRADHGLAPTTLAATRRAQADTHWPILHGISPHVVPRPRDWRPGLDVVGYWWPPMPPDWTPPAELCRFVEAGPPPVFIGFGSTNPGDPDRLSHTVVTALRRAGRRGVIQAGWAELASTDDDMLTVGDVPHEWLFPRMAAVVHAAGAGTTAAGLRAGVPVVPVPMTGDGPFWSYRLRTLGVTPGPIRFKELTADRLADAVRQAVTEPAYRDRATEVAAAIAAEDGAAEVVRVVDASLSSVGDA